MIHEFLNLSVFLSLCAYCLSWITGHCIVYRYFKDILSPPECFFMAPAIGYAISSCLVFVGLIVGGFNAFLLIAFHIVCIIIFNTNNTFLFLKNLKQVYFALPIFLSIALIFLNALKSPYGAGLDVWAIWKLKSVFMFRSPEHWVRIFSPVIFDSHPDYPIQYPLCIVWGWITAGKEVFAAPLFLTTIFSIAQIGILSAFNQQKFSRAIILPLLLIATPQWIGMAASQYADPIMAYYMLSGFVLVQMAILRKSVKLMFLAGIVCGIGTFVKNEGLLFWLIIFICLAVENRQMIAKYFIGSLGPLGGIIAFKTLANTPSQMLSDKQFYMVLTNGSAIERLTIIFNSIIDCILKENYWIYGWIYCLFILMLYAGRVYSKYRMLTGILFLQIMGYTLIYLFTPLDLKDHLETSLDRVLYQVYPIAAYLAWAVFWNIGADKPAEFNPAV